jgi:hypothetical protein
MSKDKKNIDRWKEDTMIFVSKETRAKLKIKAIKVGKGLTLKEYLSKIANE